MAAMAVLTVASSSAKPAMKYRRQWIQRIHEHIDTTVKRVFPHLRTDKSAEGVKTLAHIGRLRPEPVSDVCLRFDFEVIKSGFTFNYGEFAIIKIRVGHRLPSTLSVKSVFSRTKCVIVVIHP